MDFRLVLFPLLLAAAAPAQGGATQPAGSTPAPAAQDPEKAGPKPVDVIGELQREKERLQKEIEFAQNRAKLAGPSLAAKLGKRGQTFAAIDAGVNMPAPTAAAPMMRKARVMTAEELGQHGQDVQATVNGLPVLAGQLNPLLEYLRSSPVSGDDTQRAQRVWFDVIRTQAMVASFPENEAGARIADAYAELEQGKPVAEVVKNFGTVQGAQPDGSVEITRNSFLGTQFEQLAFTLKPGARSRPFYTAQGAAILVVDSVEKGQSPELDKVKAHAVQVAWQTDPATLQRAMTAATTGQVEVLVRDAKVLAQLPPLYQPMAPQPVQDNGLPTLIDTLSQLDALIAKLKATDSEDAKAQLEQVQKQRAELQKAIDDMRAQQETDADKEVAPDGTVPVKKGPAGPVQKKL
ncbi:MAG: peptidylprolyl isomerase [Planctomycetes bacterium]|nr:peptidylprolyl isomerase [Planctomycetota bacterium]